MVKREVLHHAHEDDHGQEKVSERKNKKVEVKFKVFLHSEQTTKNSHSVAIVLFSWLIFIYFKISGLHIRIYKM